MLIAWMQTNKTTNWSRGLWEVQFCKNRALHEGIKRSPYEAMFGVKAKVGLSTLLLPAEVINHVTTEEELEAALGESGNLDDGESESDDGSISDGRQGETMRSSNNEESASENGNLQQETRGTTFAVLQVSS
jgi:hypothetical protein